MALATYNELLQELIDWSVSADISAKAPLFVRQAESRHKRDIRVRAMVKRKTFEISQVSGRYVPLPDGFLEMQNLRALDSVPYSLQEVSRQTMDVSNAGERPTQFCTFNDQIELNRASSVDLEMNYWQAFPALSTSNQTNWLLDEYPNAYLFAALVEVFSFTEDDEQMTKYEARYGQEVGAIRSQDNRSRFKGMRSRPDLVWTP